MSDEDLKCTLCADDKDSSEVLILECKHVFCLFCLEDYIGENLSAAIKCPIDECNQLLSDNQIRNTLSAADINRYDSILIQGLMSTHNCLLPDCRMTVEYENRDIQYDCRNCSLYNCIDCGAAHKSLSCKNFRKLSKIKADQICEKEIRRAEKKWRERQLVQTRQALLVANEIDLFESDENFECVLCCLIVGKGKGVKLRNCFHMVCRECLKNYIISSDKSPIKCPDGYCQATIEDREIKKILSEEEFDMYTRKMLNRIKPKLVNYFQCQSPDCFYFCELKDFVGHSLECPKCKVVNCIPCNAIHENETCDNYKSKNYDLSLRFVEDQIKDGKCMRCPDCKTLVRKVSGCNWIQCPNCGVELCWILQIHRWGPKGRGDISGGCRCMEDNVPCHPDCGGCIPHEDGVEGCVLM